MQLGRQDNRVTEEERKRKDLLIAVKRYAINNDNGNGDTCMQIELNRTACFCRTAGKKQLKAQKQDYCC